MVKDSIDINISCILAAWNESISVSKVVSTLARYPRFYEIVLVNDASTDSTLRIFNRYKHKDRRIKVIDIKKNGGKANAILQGVKKSTGEILVFVDGDLLTLNHEHLDSLVDPILRKEYDMTILEKGSDLVSPVGWMQFIANRPYGGERALWRKDFNKIGITGEERFGLETKINDWYIDNNKRVTTIHASDLHALYKSQKQIPLTSAIIQWGNQLKDIYKHSSPKSAIIQSVEIEDTRIRGLHELKRKTRWRRAVLAGIFLTSLTLSISTFLALNLRKGIVRVGKARR